jgi:RHS repeat-associated protein
MASGFIATGTVSLTYGSLPAGARVQFLARAGTIACAGGNTAPTVSITAPAAGASFSAPANITLTANAQDSDGTVTQVQYFANASPIGTATASPYSFNWANVAAGAYSLTARATDNAGASTTSAPVAITVGAAQAKLYFIHTDHLNTPRLIADEQQRTVWRWDNTDPFGGNPPDENPSGLGAFDLPLRLPGQYFDEETNLHYNYFRDYDAGIGRYMQSDPIGLAGGLNTYAYVAGNPLRTTDERGLFGPGGAAAGAAVSVLVQTLTCRALGGDLSLCLKCIDWSDVAVSAAVGTAFPTWLGDVGKSIALAAVLSRLGVAGVGGATRKEIVNMAVGAAVGTGVGVAAKVSSPSVQIECEANCEPYRLPSVVKGLSTSVF